MRERIHTRWAAGGGRKQCADSNAAEDERAVSRVMRDPCGPILLKAHCINLRYWYIRCILAEHGVAVLARQRRPAFLIPRTILLA